MITYASISTEQVRTGQGCVTSKAGARETSQEVVGRSTGGHVARYGLGHGLRGGAARSWSRIAGGALDKVDGVARLDLVRGKRVLVLHHPARVDETLAFDRNALELFGGELVLEVQNGGGLGHGDCVVLFARSLYLERDLGGLAGALGIVGHG